MEYSIKTLPDQSVLDKDLIFMVLFIAIAWESGYKGHPFGPIQKSTESNRTSINQIKLSGVFTSLIEIIT
jgi:hypothetical protein